MARNLGYFEPLPTEIRHQIWEYLRPQRVEDFESGMLILQACRTLYDDVSERMYRDVLTFYVSPVYDHDVWIKVKNQHGYKWRLQSLLPADSKGLSTLPYAKLDGIIIKIMAPKERDPGQLVCLWSKVRDLVYMLSMFKELPQIEIILQETPSTTWVKENIPQKSVQRTTDATLAAKFGSDFLEVLVPFCCLRNARDAKVYLSESLETIPQYFIPVIEMGMRLPGRFGEHTDSDSDVARYDKIIQNLLDDSFSRFNSALDILDGETAAMMRLRRLSFWFDNAKDFGNSSYVDEMERVITRRGVDAEQSHEDVVALRWRYRLMVAFNSESFRMEHMRYEKGFYPHQMDRHILFRDVFAVPLILSDHWDLAQWENYFQAIFNPELFKARDREERQASGLWKTYNTKFTWLRLPRYPAVTAIARMGSFGEGDRWCRDSWYKYYPDGLPKFGENLYAFELQMGHLWSTDSPLDPGHRFAHWGKALPTWEQEIRYDMLQLAKQQRYGTFSTDNAVFYMHRRQEAQSTRGSG